MKAVLIGVAAAFFFAFTFVLNRSIEVGGGSWLWSASLRYFFMIPLLAILVILRRNLTGLWVEMKKSPVQWLIWSTIGFGLFYAPMCAAAIYSPGWLTAAAFEMTIVAGMIMSPLFFFVRYTPQGPIQERGKIPRAGMLAALIILTGIGLMQWEQVRQHTEGASWQGIVLIAIAAFAYPLGNRKMMEVCDGRLDAFQRTLGMSIASLPVWIILACIGAIQSGLPSGAQTGQTFLVALFSGVVATVLFFGATDQVRHHPARLATVEATQALEVVFTLLGEWLLLGVMLSSVGMWVGLVLVIGGMAVNAILSVREPGISHKHKSNHPVT